MIEYKNYFIIGTNDNALHDTMNGNVTGELIRCKECKYSYEGFRKYVCQRPFYEFSTEPEKYCGYAKRKETE